MHTKEKRKLEILLELRKYIDNHIIVGDIDEILTETLVDLKEGSKIYKILISVTKNCIYVQPKYFLEDINNLTIICPKFKPLKEESILSVNNFFNKYINFFKEDEEFNLLSILKNDMTQTSIMIKNNLFYTHLNITKTILFSDRKVKYIINLTLHDIKGLKQDFIISSVGDGTLKIALSYESHYISQPYEKLLEKDYIKYFLYTYNHLFNKNNLEIGIDQKSSFSDIKQSLILLDILDF